MRSGTTTGKCHRSPIQCCFLEKQGCTSPTSNRSAQFQHLKGRVLGSLLIHHHLFVHVHQVSMAYCKHGLSNLSREEAVSNGWVVPPLSQNWSTLCSIPARRSRHNCKGGPSPYTVHRLVGSNVAGWGDLYYQPEITAVESL